MDNFGEIISTGQDTANKDRICENCKNIQKKLDISRQWNAFFKTKMLNVDKMLHIISDFEREKQKNLELQLAYDERSREWSKQHEQLKSLLHEIQPLRDRLKYAEETMKREIEEKIQMQYSEQGLKIVIDQLNAKNAELKVLCNPVHVENLNKRFNQTKNAQKKLKNEISSYKEQIETLQEYVSSKNAQADKTLKKYFQHLKTSIEFANRLEKIQDLSYEDELELANLNNELKETEELLNIRYDTYRFLYMKKYSEKKFELNQVLSFETWMVTYDVQDPVETGGKKEEDRWKEDLEEHEFGELEAEIIQLNDVESGEIEGEIVQVERIDRSVIEEEIVQVEKIDNVGGKKSPKKKSKKYDEVNKKKSERVGKRKYVRKTVYGAEEIEYSEKESFWDDAVDACNKVRELENNENSEIIVDGIDVMQLSINENDETDTNNKRKAMHSEESDKCNREGEVELRNNCSSKKSKSIEEIILRKSCRNKSINDGLGQENMNSGDGIQAENLKLSAYEQNRLKCSSQNVSSVGVDAPVNNIKTRRYSLRRKQDNLSSSDCDSLSSPSCNVSKKLKLLDDSVSEPLDLTMNRSLESASPSAGLADSNVPRTEFCAPADHSKYRRFTRSRAGFSNKNSTVGRNTPTLEFNKGKITETLDLKADRNALPDSKTSKTAVSFSKTDDRNSLASDSKTRVYTLEPKTKRKAAVTQQPRRNTRSSSRLSMNNVAEKSLSSPVKLVSFENAEKDLYTEKESNTPTNAENAEINLQKRRKIVDELGKNAYKSPENSDASEIIGNKQTESNDEPKRNGKPEKSVHKRIENADELRKITDNNEQVKDVVKQKESSCNVEIVLDKPEETLNKQKENTIEQGKIADKYKKEKGVVKPNDRSCNAEIVLDKPENAQTEAIKSLLPKDSRAKSVFDLDRPVKSPKLLGFSRKRSESIQNKAANQAKNSEALKKFEIQLKNKEIELRNRELELKYRELEYKKDRVQETFKSGSYEDLCAARRKDVKSKNKSQDKSATKSRSQKQSGSRGRKQNKDETQSTTINENVSKNTSNSEIRAMTRPQTELSTKNMPQAKNRAGKQNRSKVKKENDELKTEKVLKELEVPPLLQFSFSSSEEETDEDTADALLRSKSKVAARKVQRRTVKEKKDALFRGKKIVNERIYGKEKETKFPTGREARKLINLKPEQKGKLLPKKAKQVRTKICPRDSDEDSSSANEFGSCFKRKHPKRNKSGVRQGEIDNKNKTSREEDRITERAINDGKNEAVMRNVKNSNIGKNRMIDNENRKNSQITSFREIKDTFKSSLLDTSSSSDEDVSPKRIRKTSSRISTSSDSDKGREVLSADQIGSKGKLSKAIDSGEGMVSKYIDSSVQEKNIKINEITTSSSRLRSHDDRFEKVIRNRSTLSESSFDLNSSVENLCVVEETVRKNSENTQILNTETASHEESKNIFNSRKEVNITSIFHDSFSIDSKGKDFQSPVLKIKQETSISKETLLISETRGEKDLVTVECAKSVSVSKNLQSEISLSSKTEKTPKKVLFSKKCGSRKQRTSSLFNDNSESEGRSRVENESDSSALGIMSGTDSESGRKRESEDSESDSEDSDSDKSLKIADFSDCDPLKNNPSDYQESPTLDSNSSQEHLQSSAYTGLERSGSKKLEKSQVSENLELHVNSKRLEKPNLSNSMPSFYKERKDSENENTADIPDVLSYILGDLDESSKIESVPVKSEDFKSSEPGSSDSKAFTCDPKPSNDKNFALQANKKMSLEIKRSYPFTGQKSLKTEETECEKLLDIFQDLLGTRPGTPEWPVCVSNISDFFSNIEADNTLSKLQYIVKTILICILQSSPYEKQESSFQLSSTMFKLFQVSRILERRHNLREFSIENLVNAAVHRITIIQDLRPKTLSVLTSWIVASFQNQYYNKASPEDEDCLHQCRSYIIDLLFYNRGKVHDALLNVFNNSKKVFIFTFKREYTCIDHMIGWIIHFGQWSGPKKVREKLIEILHRFNYKYKPNERPKDIIKLILKDFIDKNCTESQKKRALAGFLLFLTWVKGNWVTDNLLVTLKQIYYEESSNISKVDLETLKKFLGEQVKKVDWPESFLDKFMDKLKIFPIIK